MDTRKIGPSAITTFGECFFKWYLVYIAKLSEFKQSIHTIFGNAAHDAIQQSFLNKSLSNAKSIFENRFDKYINDNKDKLTAQDFSRVDELRQDGHNIFDNIENSGFYEAIDFGKLEQVVCEEEIKEQINENWLFSGRLDLVFYYNGKYRIWDIKTSKATWDFEKLRDISVISQPLLYKYFWAKKHNVDLQKITTDYLFLNKKDTKLPINVKRIPSGQESIKKAVFNLHHYINLIEKNKFYKSHNSKICKWCEFYMTEHCPCDVLQKN